jgi:predicted nucleotidyltransferase
MEETIGRIVTPFLESAGQELGGGFAAVLYGSGARGEYLAGVSDINLLVVSQSLGPETLRRLSGALQGLWRQHQRPPLLVDRAEWERATDVFPIEITDMLRNREVLRGEDPVKGLTVDPADLRRMLEHELRGKLLRLRQIYALHSADPRALGEAGVHTAASVAALFRAALALHGREVPRSTPACLTAAGTALGIPTSPLADLWRLRGAKDPACPPATFEGYLSAVAAAVRVIDQFTPGGN